MLFYAVRAVLTHDPLPRARHGGSQARHGQPGSGTFNGNKSSTDDNQTSRRLRRRGDGYAIAVGSSAAIPD